jgi:hypothetical protein
LKVVFQVDALLSMNETVCHQTRHWHTCKHKTYCEHSYVHHMLFIFFWHSMFYHHVSKKCRERTRGCHQMPFLIMLLCQKNRFFAPEKTTTSKLKVLIAACILNKQRHQFTRDSIYVNKPETGIALFFL